MTVNDSVMKALYDLGYRGSYNDRVLSHMKDELGVTNINEGYYKAGGFGKYVGDLISGGSVTNYVARPDGVSQYWLLSEPITINSNSLIKLSFVGGVPSNQYSRFLVSGSGYVGVGGDVSVFDSGGVNAGETKVNSQMIQKGVTQVPQDGVNVLSFATFGSSTMETVGSSSTGGNKMSLPLFNFEVWQNGVLVNSIPLTNKDQGATQIATVGSVNATMINYTPDVWEEI